MPISRRCGAISVSLIRRQPPLRSGRWPMRSAPSSTSPAWGFSRKFRQRRQVDLPEPLGPISDRVSPFFRSKEMPLSTSAGP